MSFNIGPEFKKEVPLSGESISKEQSDKKPEEETSLPKPERPSNESANIDLSDKKANEIKIEKSLENSVISDEIEKKSIESAKTSLENSIKQIQSLHNKIKVLADIKDGQNFVGWKDSYGNPSFSLEDSYLGFSGYLSSSITQRFYTRLSKEETLNQLKKTFDQYIKELSKIDNLCKTANIPLAQIYKSLNVSLYELKKIIDVIDLLSIGDDEEAKIHVSLIKFEINEVYDAVLKPSVISDKPPFTICRNQVCNFEQPQAITIQSNINTELEISLKEKFDYISNLVSQFSSPLDSLVEMILGIKGDMELIECLLDNGEKVSITKDFQKDLQRANEIIVNGEKLTAQKPQGGSRAAENFDKLRKGLNLSHEATNCIGRFAHQGLFNEIQTRMWKEILQQKPDARDPDSVSDGSLSFSLSEINGEPVVFIVYHGVCPSICGEKETPEYFVGFQKEISISVNELENLSQYSIEELNSGKIQIKKLCPSLQVFDTRTSLCKTADEAKLMIPPPLFMIKKTMKETETQSILSISTTTPKSSSSSAEEISIKSSSLKSSPLNASEEKDIISIPSKSQSTLSWLASGVSSAYSSVLNVPSKVYQSLPSLPSYKIYPLSSNIDLLLVEALQEDPNVYYTIYNNDFRSILDQSTEFYDEDIDLEIVQILIKLWNNEATHEILVEFLKQASLTKNRNIEILELGNCPLYEDLQNNNLTKIFTDANTKFWKNDVLSNQQVIKSSEFISGILSNCFLSTTIYNDDFRFEFEKVYKFYPNGLNFETIQVFIKLWNDDKFRAGLKDLIENDIFEKTCRLYPDGMNIENMQVLINLWKDDEFREGFKDVIENAIFVKACKLYPNGIDIETIQVLIKLWKDDEFREAFKDVIENAIYVKNKNVEILSYGQLPWEEDLYNQQFRELVQRVVLRFMDLVDDDIISTDEFNIFTNFINDFKSEIFNPKLTINLKEAYQLFSNSINTEFREDLKIVYTICKTDIAIDKLIALNYAWKDEIFRNYFQRLINFITISRDENLKILKAGGSPHSKMEHNKQLISNWSFINDIYFELVEAKIISMEQKSDLVSCILQLCMRGYPSLNTQLHSDSIGLEFYAEDTLSSKYTRILKDVKKEEMDSQRIVILKQQLQELIKSDSGKIISDKIKELRNEIKKREQFKGYYFRDNVKDFLKFECWTPQIFSIDPIGVVYRVIGFQTKEGSKKLESVSKLDLSFLGNRDVSIDQRNEISKLMKACDTCAETNPEIYEKLIFGEEKLSESKEAISIEELPTSLEEQTLEELQKMYAISIDKLDQGFVLPKSLSSVLEKMDWLSSTEKKILLLEILRFSKDVLRKYSFNYLTLGS